ncbi:biotin-dependent carboxyltransferase family protein [Nocardioidaceae bacterium SCSIO 66511]|nr:biotin-dependent carboxyltransferase family protein [Nocardioidaceae bacterium SCSIO 66511]
MSRALEVVRPGALALIEDRGRRGLAQIGVGVSGAADRRSYDLANRLLGNVGGAAAIEVTLGGLEVIARSDLWVAVTGAPAPMHVDGSSVATYSVEFLRAGARLTMGIPPTGLRSYFAVRGGIDAPVVLGSRSYDVMSELGPAPLQPGDVLSVGSEVSGQPRVDVAPVSPPGTDVELRVVRGPRDGHIAEPDVLVDSVWTASPDSNRIGMRLEGGRITPAHESAGQLPSEGAWRGAVQVPPGGQPVVFLADHPVTGGYPVVAVVIDADVDRAAQVRPGQQVRFSWVAA